MHEERVNGKGKDDRKHSKDPASLELQRFTALTLPLTKCNCGVEETGKGSTVALCKV